MLFKNNRDAGLCRYDRVDEAIQKQARKAAAKIGGREHVMDLENGYEVVNVVDLKKIAKSEAAFGKFSGICHRYEWSDYEYDIDYVSYPCLGVNKKGNVQVYDADGNPFRFYAVQDKDGDYSAIMLIENGSLQEFRVKEASEENLSHVRKVAEHLRQSSQEVLSELFVDDKGNCSAPKGFVINNVPNVYDLYHDRSPSPHRFGIFPVKNGVFPDLSKCVVKGSFNVSHSNLGSFEGRMPEFIYGSFSCVDNNLESLKDGPKFVKGYYDCSGNRIGNFDDLDCNIKGPFIFDYYWEDKDYNPISESWYWCSGWEKDQISNIVPWSEPAWRAKLRNKVYGCNLNNSDILWIKDFGKYRD